MTWDEVTNFRQLQSLYVQFLSGEVNNNPWNYVTSTDIKPMYGIVLEKLKEITKCGFITIEQQSGICINHMMHRGYLEGFMQKNLLDKINGTTLAVFAYDYNTQRVLTNAAADQLIRNLELQK